MELTSKHLIFCFPNKTVGGVSLMFIRLATSLHHQGYTVSIIDYEDGFMNCNNEAKIPLLTYFDEAKVLVPENAILVCQTLLPWAMYPSLILPCSTALFFITTIPFNCYPLLPGLRSKMSEAKFISKLIWATILHYEFILVKKFLTVSQATHSIVFLDANVITNLQNTFAISLPSNLLFPLFSQDSKDNLYLKKNNLKLSKLSTLDKITIAWVGRIASFKVHILNRLIQDLDAYVRCKKTVIHFKIIGSEEYGCKLTSPKTHGLEIFKIHEIAPGKLGDFLLNCDAVFAMGTSVLDSARLGIPTICLDYSFKTIKPNYRYKFFHETIGFSLGEHIDTPGYHYGRHSIDDVINVINQEPEKLSNYTISHYNKYHCLNHASELLIESLKNSSLTWGKMKGDRLTFSPFFSLWKYIRKTKFTRLFKLNKL